MSRFYNFKIHVRGKKKECLAILANQPAIDAITVICEYVDPQTKDYIIHFQGICNKSLEENAIDTINLENELDNYTEEEILSGQGPDWFHKSMKDKAKTLKCDIEAYENCVEEGVQKFTKIDKDGKIVYQKEAQYKWDFEPEVELYWDRREYFRFEDWINALKNSGIDTNEIIKENLLKEGNGVFCYKKVKENNIYDPEFTF